MWCSSITARASAIARCTSRTASASVAAAAGSPPLPPTPLLPACCVWGLLPLPPAAAMARNCPPPLLLGPACACADDVWCGSGAKEEVGRSENERLGRGWLPPPVSQATVLLVLWWLALEGEGAGWW